MLVAGASVVLLLQPRVARWQARDGAENRRGLRATLGAVGVYVGYFGAAGGVLMLAVLSAMLNQSLARTNAVKNVISALANGVAACGFAIFGPVQWSAAIPLAGGFLVGGWLGPHVVRRVPSKGLRMVVGVCGLLLAAQLGLATYGQG